MIYRNGKKVGAIFRNGQAISNVFRNGKLVWQKAKPEAKRVKSIKFWRPSWGTIEWNEFESTLRAVPEDIRNHYLDVLIKGVPVRLRGAGGRHRGTLGYNTIELPSTLFVTTDDVHSGMELSFVSKLPSVTSEPTYKYSIDSFRANAFYQFENAPFLNGSYFEAYVYTSKNAAWELKADLTGAFTTVAGSVVSTGTTKGGLRVEYKDENYKKMATTGTDFWMTIKPSFYITLGISGTIGAAKLVSPACRLTHKLKIVSVETY